MVTKSFKFYCCLQFWRWIHCNLSRQFIVSYWQFSSCALGSVCRLVLRGRSHSFSPDLSVSSHFHPFLVQNQPFWWHWAPVWQWFGETISVDMGQQAGWSSLLCWALCFLLLWDTCWLYPVAYTAAILSWLSLVGNPTLVARLWYWAWFGFPPPLEHGYSLSHCTDSSLPPAPFTSSALSPSHSPLSPYWLVV